MNWKNWLATWKIYFDNSSSYYISKINSRWIKVKAKIMISKCDRKSIGDYLVLIKENLLTKHERMGESKGNLTVSVTS